MSWGAQVVGLLLLLAVVADGRQGVTAVADDARALLAAEGLLAPYERVARALASGARKSSPGPAPGDPGAALPRVARALADPLQFEAEVRHLTERAWTAVAGSRVGAADLLILAADLLDRPLAPAAPPALPRPGAPPEEHLTAIERLFDDVRRLRDEAFAPLTGEDRALLGRALGPFLDRLARMPARGEAAPEADAAARELLGLTRTVDLARLLDAARRLALLAEPQALVTLRRDFLRALPRLPPIRHPLAAGDVRLVRETPHGPFIVGGPGRTAYRGEAALIVDLGGSNRYENNAGAAAAWERPVAAAIDFGHGTHFVRRDRPSQGAGLYGVGLLVTTGDGVRFDGGRASQGAGLFGVGLLVALGRRQRFAAGEVAQGIGLAGAGILLAAGEENEYLGGPVAQGVGATRGVGLLVNRGGSNLFRVEGRPGGPPGAPTGSSALAQGIGTGYPGLAPGGVGMLLAGGWRNALYAGPMAQGGGQALGLGILDLRGGEHTLRGGPHAQGFGLRSAAGLARIEWGRNHLRAPREAQGIGTDLAVGVLLVGGERNRLEVGSVGQGAGVRNGLGLLHVAGGGNTYAGDAARGHAAEATPEGGAGSLGLWLSPEGRRAAYRAP
jgi:hypothetical protein